MLRKQKNLQVLKIRDKRTLSKTELVICHLVFLNYFFPQISHQEKIELKPFLWKMQILKNIVNTSQRL